MPVGESVDLILWTDQIEDYCAKIHLKMCLCELHLSVEVVEIIAQPDTVIFLSS